MNRRLAVAALVLVAGCGRTDHVFDARPPGPCIGVDHPVPRGGWLADDGVLPAAEGEVREESAELDAIVDALPDGFTVTRAEETYAGDCVAERIVEVGDGGGATVWVQVRQLDATATVVNVPLSGRQAQDQHGERGELVTDDFDGQSNRRTALVITDTGTWTLGIARGANGEDLSGWPTTTTNLRAPAGEPEEAPLTIGEVARLADAISASTSTR